MRSVKSITLKNLLVSCGLQFLICGFINAQDNSPYSRYGLGDISPNTNIVNRGMGSFSAAYADPLSINFTNPASYASFLAYSEERSRKSVSGRVLFDVGLNITNHTLREGSTANKFASSDILFSYLQVGLPVKKNWGLSFGLRQLTRIGYKIDRFERLFDSNTGLPIDSAATEFSGDGGVFLATIGTGFAIRNFTIGVNVGYLFGKKEYDTKRLFINDTVAYNSSHHSTKTSFGKVYANGGIQYKIDLSKKLLLRLGAYGSLQQKLNAQQDILRETIVGTPTAGDLRLDSVYEQKGVKGQIIYPAGYGFGFVLEKKPDLQNNKYGNWLIGADFVTNNWSEYRYYGTIDSVQDNWELRVGGQIRPEPKKNYFSNVNYRGGLFIGQDYVHVENKLPLFGLSFGLGLPVANYSNLARNQASFINLAFEYVKRGNNSDLMKENIFRISVGLSLTDIWFSKHKYD